MSGRSVALILGDISRLHGVRPAFCPRPFTCYMGVVMGMLDGYKKRDRVGKGKRCLRYLRCFWDTFLTIAEAIVLVVALTAAYALMSIPPN